MPTKKRPHYCTNALLIFRFFHYHFTRLTAACVTIIAYVVPNIRAASFKPCSPFLVDFFVFLSFVLCVVCLSFVLLFIFLCF